AREERFGLFQVVNSDCWHCRPPRRCANPGANGNHILVSATRTQRYPTIRSSYRACRTYHVRLGIHLEDDPKGNSSLELILNANRTRINRLGGEWRNDVRLGRNLGVVSEFFQPLD